MKKKAKLPLKSSAPSEVKSSGHAGRKSSRKREAPSHPTERTVAVLEEETLDHPDRSEDRSFPHLEAQDDTHIDDEEPSEEEVFSNLPILASTTPGVHLGAHPLNDRTSGRHSSEEGDEIRAI